MESTERKRTWAEIDLRALRHNVEVARRHAPGMAIMAVVKADAYGHGLGRIAEALRDSVEWFGVANVEEGLEVAARAPQKVFVLGPLLDWERPIAIEAGFVVTVSNREEAEDYNRLGEEKGTAALVHIAVDTGMGRMGCLESDLPTLAERCESLSHVKLQGIATHFPSADEDARFTKDQIAEAKTLFSDLIGKCEIHLSNSAGLLGFASEQPFSTIVRPGLMLYGVSPLPEFEEELQPVMSLKSRVTLVRDLPAGRGISYGRSYLTAGPSTQVATIGLGYGDGYPRHVSNRGASVLIQGKRCPLLGRVTMDQIVVDVSHLDPIPKIGEAATLIGRDGNESITTAEVADWAGTIPWEVLTGITRRVERVYLGE